MTNALAKINLLLFFLIYHHNTVPSYVSVPKSRSKNTCSAAPPQRFTFLQDKYNHNLCTALTTGLGTPPTGGTMSECMNYCATVCGCTVFTYYETTKKCLVFEDMHGNLVKVPGCISVRVSRYKLGYHTRLYQYESE